MKKPIDFKRSCQKALYFAKKRKKFQNGYNCLVIEARFVQSWSEIILATLNQFRAACSFDSSVTIFLIKHECFNCWKIRHS